MRLEKIINILRKPEYRPTLAYASKPKDIQSYILYTI